MGLKKILLGKTYVVTCPDGSKRTVHRDIDDIIPNYLTITSTELSKKLKAGFSGNGVELENTYKSNPLLQALVQDMESVDGSLRFDFKLRYVQYQADPCGQYHMFCEFVNKITEEHANYRKMSAFVDAFVKLCSIPNCGENAIEKAVMQIIGYLGDYAIASNAVIAIRESRTDIDKWEDGQNG